MTKEMIVSSNDYETRVAIIEDDEVSELFIERENQRGVVGTAFSEVAVQIDLHDWIIQRRQGKTVKTAQSSIVSASTHPFRQVFANSADFWRP